MGIPLTQSVLYSNLVTGLVHSLLYNNLVTSLVLISDEFYLEEDLSESGRGENEIPRALYLVLKSLRVFGHVDFSVFVELMKDIQVKQTF